MRLSHARESSTVLPFLEKFISSRATAAQTTAVTVDFAENWYKIELSDGETLCGQGLPYEKNAE